MISASAQVRRMIAEDVSNTAERNYNNSWRAAGGFCQETPAPVPFVPPNDFCVRSQFGCDVYAWTSKKDDNGKWWSFRIRMSRSAIVASTFDTWAIHDQRQQAKARAKANAKIARRQQEAA